MYYLVKVGTGEERAHKLSWLKENGFSGEIPNEYRYGVIIIDHFYFFGGNVTCFAAAASAGNCALDWTEWLQAYEDDIFYSANKRLISTPLQTEDNML